MGFLHIMRSFLPRFLVIQSLLLSPCLGYPHYQKEIPNGGRVAHPCRDNHLWYGVGHLNVQGGGERNFFGVDYAAAGGTWSRQLCQKDSDGDGQTNGQELGDPNCVWTKGQVPASTTGITHPGVCEPIDSVTCRNKSAPSNSQGYRNQQEWLDGACKNDQFQCEPTKASDVQTLELRMPLTQVPATETTLMCMTYEFPKNSTDFHIIAIEPIVNNTEVLHHMRLMACSDTTVIKDKPESCPGMAGMLYPDSVLMGGWVLGTTGMCFLLDVGFLVGATGYKKFAIQFHWNNPQKRPDFQDSPGLRLYYTSKLRPHNLAVMQVGQYQIQIPPRSPHTLVTGECPSTCTSSLFTGDIRVVDGFNHMHYLGVAMNIELHRGGKFVTNITNDLIYRYDTPKHQLFADPLVLKPGDMIRTNCHFATPDKTITTFFGDGTSDEMCYGYFSFYPKENMPKENRCIPWKNFLDCDPDSIKGCSSEIRLTYMNSSSFNQTAVYRNVTSFCKTFGPCTEECKTLVRQIRTTETCFNNEDSWLLLKWNLLQKHDLGMRFLAAFTSCDLELYQEDHTADDLEDGLVKAAAVLPFS